MRQHKAGAPHTHTPALLPHQLLLFEVVEPLWVVSLKAQFQYTHTKQEKPQVYYFQVPPTGMQMGGPAVLSARSQASMRGEQGSQHLLLTGSAVAVANSSQPQL